MPRHKLMFVIDRFGDFGAGTERRLENLVNNLLDRSLFEICVISVYREEGAAEHFRGSANYMALFDGAEGIKVHSLCRKLVGAIGQVEPDVVNTYFIDPYLAAGYARYFCRFRWVHHMRSMGYFMGRKFRIMDLPVRGRVDGYVVNSRAIADFLHSTYGVREDATEVIYNGIPDKFFEAEVGEDPPGEGFVVGTVANIRPVKGLEVLLEAASFCRERIPGLRLLVVGDNRGDYAEQMARKAEALSVPVEFAGRQADVVPFINRFHVAVNSSRSEGFSNAVLEYMALGKPVVLSDGGGNPEAIVEGESGLLFRSGDAGDLAAKILRLHRDEGFRRRLGLSARERCRMLFSEEEEARRYNRFFAGCCAG